MSTFPTATPTPGPDESFGGRAFAPREDAAVAGVGIDVVDIARLAAMIDRTPALVERLFTPAERGLSDASRAARVAAKEAVGKALGAPGDFSWQDVTVERTTQRRPYLRLRGATLRAAERQNVADLHLSLSHDGNIATAIVVAERAAPAAGGSQVGGPTAACTAAAGSHDPHDGGRP
ncbi:holo-ACP synthase [Brachybacterium sp. UNK5269]|uniref:holo-ACP synthase n=1 Tax=Brachybacterium sp. UNK5269 TaxID=3408576 RepID=UPI003BB0B8BD